MNINYSNGSDPLGLCRYILDEGKQKEAQAKFFTNLSGRDAEELAIEFRFYHDLKPKVRKTMRHFSLSFAPGEVITPETFEQAVGRLLKLTGHQNCPFVATQHFDQEQKHGVAHGHVAVGTIEYTGKWVSDSNILRRLKQEDRALGRSIERQIEADLGLVPVEVRPEEKRRNLTTGEYRLKERTGGALPKEKLWEAIDLAAQDHPTMPQLVSRLKMQGVEVRFSEFEAGEKGISFAIDGGKFQGRKLGKAYSFDGLQQHRGVSYAPERDDVQLRELNNLGREDAAALLQDNRIQQPDPGTITPGLTLFSFHLEADATSARQPGSIQSNLTRLSGGNCSDAGQCVGAGAGRQLAATLSVDRSDSGSPDADGGDAARIDGCLDDFNSALPIAGIDVGAVAQAVAGFVERREVRRHGAAVAAGLESVSAGIKQLTEICGAVGEYHQESTEPLDPVSVLTPEQQQQYEWAVTIFLELERLQRDNLIPRWSEMSPLTPIHLSGYTGVWNGEEQSLTYTRNQDGQVLFTAQAESEKSWVMTDFEGVTLADVDYHQSIESQPKRPYVRSRQQQQLEL